MTAIAQFSFLSPSELVEYIEDMIFYYSWIGLHIFWKQGHSPTKVQYTYTNQETDNDTILHSNPQTLSYFSICPINMIREKKQRFSFFGMESNSRSHAVVSYYVSLVFFSLEQLLIFLFSIRGVEFLKLFYKQCLFLSNIHSTCIFLLISIIISPFLVKFRIKNNLWVFTVKPVHL